MEGHGELTFPDGRIYIGEYKNDKIEGYGEFRWPNGKIFKGMWVGGMQHGDGALIDHPPGGFAHDVSDELLVRRGPFG